MEVFKNLIKPLKVSHVTFLLFENSSTSLLQFYTSQMSFSPLYKLCGEIYIYIHTPTKFT